jgi:hypothetical protein
MRTGYTRATHGPQMNGITDPQCPFYDTETEQTKIGMMITPEIWTRGAEGMKKIFFFFFFFIITGVSNSEWTTALAEAI